MPKFLLILMFLILGACSDQEASYPQRNMPSEFTNTVTNLDEVQQLFMRSCANCHGTLAEGRISRADFFQPPAPDFTALSYRQVDPAYLFWRIAEGKMVEPYRSMGSVMPAWGAHLSDKQIWQMIAYLQTRSRH
ncbi:MAG: cytochrome c [Alcanivorax sp.]|nr:cytochrome c [Alcanivorax sp.]